MLSRYDQWKLATPPHYDLPETDPGDRVTLADFIARNLKSVLTWKTRPRSSGGGPVVKTRPGSPYTLTRTCPSAIGRNYGGTRTSPAGRWITILTARRTPRLVFFMKTGEGKGGRLRIPRCGIVAELNGRTPTPDAWDAAMVRLAGKFYDLADDGERGEAREFLADAGADPALIPAA